MVLTRRQIPRFLEVYADCPLETCMVRDPKGTYRTANTVPGLQVTYEPPDQAEVVVQSNLETAEAAATRIIAVLGPQSWQARCTD